MVGRTPSLWQGEPPARGGEDPRPVAGRTPNSVQEEALHAKDVSAQPGGGWPEVGTRAHTRSVVCLRVTLSGLYCCLPNLASLHQ